MPAPRCRPGRDAAHFGSAARRRSCLELTLFRRDVRRFRTLGEVGAQRHRQGQRERAARPSRGRPPGRWTGRESCARDFAGRARRPHLPVLGRARPGAPCRCRRRRRRPVCRRPARRRRLVVRGRRAPPRRAVRAVPRGPACHHDPEPRPPGLAPDDRGLPRCATYSDTSYSTVTSALEGEPRERDLAGVAGGVARGSPRCAAAGCTWRRARCGRGHRS